MQMDAMRTERAVPLGQLTWVHGGLGMLSLMDDGTGWFCSDVGDVTIVSAELVCRLKLADGARLHARVRQAKSGTATFEHVLAWHRLKATVVATDGHEIELRGPGGVRVLMPAAAAADHHLGTGMVLEVVAAPAAGDRLPWRVVAVQKWPRLSDELALSMM